MVSVDFCLSEVREGSYLQPGVCFDNNKSSKMTMNPFDEVQIAYSFVLSSFASPWMRETAQLCFYCTRVCLLKQKHPCLFAVSTAVGQD